VPEIWEITEKTTPPNSPPIRLQHPALISQEALIMVTQTTWDSNILSFTPDKLRPPQQLPHDIAHFCAPVTHPTTGELITSYKELARDPITKEIWMDAFGKEFGNQAQGDKKTGTPGTDSYFVLTHDQIKTIPRDRTVTYARVVVDFRPQKPDPN
jgi:hypothetical protein